MALRLRRRKWILIAWIAFLITASFLFASLTAFRRTVIHKTQFTADDEERLKSIIGIRLPAAAKIDWAMLYHSAQDTDYYFRILLPSGDAKKLRQSVELAGVINNGYPHFLAREEAGRDTEPSVDAAFATNDSDVDWIIFCRPEHGWVPVYFEVSGFPYRRNLGIDDLFFPRKK
jgi:hypothetical protein